ncbi:MAG: tetratricopeptide repeat protein [Candidatus Rokubacteria bacterium]|nr:tetratricopeptide repeat protein [Candidatus Rokubacteria bacterium]
MRYKLLAGTAAILMVLLSAGGARAQRTEADVYVAQAILDFEDKSYASALDNLSRALAVEPDNVDALYYSGVVRMAQDLPAQATPFLERARAKAPGSLPVAFQLGLAYFGQQLYDRARPLLEEVFRKDPGQDGLGYYVGFLRYRVKNYRGALAAFRAGRATNPEIQQLTRFYTGLALAALGLPAQAAAQVEEALRLAPSSSLVTPAERLRDSLVEARSREKRFSASVRAGAFYDDNVAVIPLKDPTEPIIGSLRRPKHESAGELLAVSAEYQWYRDPEWTSAVGYSFFGIYNNGLPSFNIHDHNFSLSATRSLAFLDTMPAELGAQFSWDTLYLDDSQFLQRSTLTLYGTVVENDSHLTQLFGRFQHKNFKQGSPKPPSREDRDAANFMLGLTHILRFEQDRHFLKGGYQMDREEAEGDNFTYWGHRLLAGAQYTLPWQNIRLKYDVDVHLRRYDERNSILPTLRPDTVRRKDQEITNIVRVEWPLPANLTLAGEYQNIRNISRLAPFDYQRNVFSMFVTWMY